MKQNAGVQSLFIVSLPRSLSMLTFRVCRDALGLAAPSWAVGGEILNHDLHRLGPWPRGAQEGGKYLTETNDPQRVRAAIDFLEAVASPRGRVYKDVVNPFVLAGWEGLPAFGVLKIRRDVADVATAMLSRGWSYPANAAPEGGTWRDRAGRRVVAHRAWRTAARRVLPTLAYGRATSALLRDDVLRGLLRAERVLDTMPGVSVAYDDLVRDEEALRNALRQLYPEADLPPLGYLDDAFRRERAQVLRRRDSSSYVRLRDRVAALRAEAIPSTSG
jgi:hypothetical protein